MRGRPSNEWLIMLGGIVLLIFVFMRQVREVQGQGELAAVSGTVGSLRTAFVLHHLHLRAALKPEPSDVEVRNPFLLLDHLPTNYRGEIRAAQADFVAPGSWVFDPECVCVGYLPLYSQWLDAPSGSNMVWLMVSPPPAPFQLNFREDYRWQGQTLDAFRP